MKETKKNLYEGMYILSATLSDDARSRALEKIKSGITQKGGEVHKVHEQGRKRLAYEVDGRREGFYYLVYFSLKPSSINDLWQEYHLNEDMIRFITLRTDNVMEKIEFKTMAVEA